MQVADNVTASGLFESVDIFMTRDATPTLAQIQDYDVILYWTYYGPQSQINLGNVFVEYINQGWRTNHLCLRKHIKLTTTRELHR